MVVDYCYGLVLDGVCIAIVLSHLNSQPLGCGFPEIVTIVVFWIGVTGGFVGNVKESKFCSVVSV